MLRLVMAAPDPEACPWVLGVDDFAIRRGQHYGTLLIDCETGAPLDLLQGRDAQPLADWLAAHPGVEVICRDRSGSFADGARTGAPQAVQVADRFHLWQNLAKVAGKCVAAHRRRLAGPAPQAAGYPVPPAGTAGETAPEPAGKFAERTRRNHTLVRALRAEGRGLREIARHLSWGLHTVQRYDRAATWQELVDGRRKAPRASKLDPFKPYLNQHAGLLTELTGQDLPQWIADASDAGLPGISSFAKGLKQDLDAVTNGLTMPWSSGPVECRVNHIKMIKRQMFGRAGLPLLRKRVLFTARS